MNDNLKSKEFYDERIRIMTEALDGLNGVDVLIVIGALTAQVISSLDNTTNLEVARSILDNHKSNVLRQLCDWGWD